MRAEYCAYCGKKLQDREEIYAVVNLMMVEISWRWINKDDPVVPIQKFYHRECFGVIAGKEFLAKYKDTNNE